MTVNQISQSTDNWPVQQATQLMRYDKNPLQMVKGPSRDMDVYLAHKAGHIKKIITKFEKEH